jgi:membrane-bound lytic murein transglycosylase A
MILAELAVAARPVARRRSGRQRMPMESLRRGLLALGIAGLAACATPDYERPLPEGWSALLPLPSGVEFPPVGDSWVQRDEIVPALDRSILWLRRPHSERFFPQAGMSHERVLASCLRMKELLETTDDPSHFQRAVEREFEPLVAAGWNGRGGGVLFTAYYTPVFEGSLIRGGSYQYPLYARPDDLVVDSDGKVLGMRGSEGYPYPSRRSLEKFHLLEGRGLELVWLRDPLDAYLCHVQGSAYIRLIGGDQLRLGYGGTNGREYTSLAEQLVIDGELRADARGLPAIRAWAEENPERLEEYMHRNERFVFFTPIEHTPHGSLDFPVTPMATLATDKSVFPRAAPVFVDCELSTGTDLGRLPHRALMLDQDTGGGIRTAGRADIYIGVGDAAGAVAGRTASEGQLYYLMLAEELVPTYAYAPAPPAEDR